MLYSSLSCSLPVVLSMCDLFGQGNCLLYPEDSGERIACELSYRAIEYRQGSRASQLLFDQAIKIGPKYAYAYYEKSVPFFKRGYFAEAVSLINKAIELEPQNYLFYRAYWYFYNNSYEYCIKDLEALYTTHNAVFETTPGGELELRLLLGMAYAQTGQVAKGIDWVRDLMESCKDQPHLKGLYDHYCLGMLYYKNNQYDLAKSEFDKQLKIDDTFGETFYYLGLIARTEADENLMESYGERAMLKMKQENGGFRLGLFGELNVKIKDVESLLGH